MPWGRLLHRHYTVVTSSLHRRCTVVTSSLHRHYTVVTSSLHRHYIFITPPSHRRHIVVTSLSQPPTSPRRLAPISKRNDSPSGSATTASRATTGSPVGRRTARSPHSPARTPRSRQGDCSREEVALRVRPGASPRDETARTIGQGLIAVQVCALGGGVRALDTRCWPPIYRNSDFDPQPSAVCVMGRSFELLCRRMHMVHLYTCARADVNARLHALLRGHTRARAQPRELPRVLPPCTPTCTPTCTPIPSAPLHPHRLPPSLGPQVDFSETPGAFQPRGSSGHSSLRKFRAMLQQKMEDQHHRSTTGAAQHHRSTTGAVQHHRSTIGAAQTHHSTTGAVTEVALGAQIEAVSESLAERSPRALKKSASTLRARATVHQVRARAHLSGSPPCPTSLPT